jgi:OOP family OmpA-OmpF porin
MPRRARFTFAWVALGSLTAFRAFAQTTANPPQFELERLELDPSALGSLMVGTGQTLEDGSYRIGLAFQYERNPLLLQVNGTNSGAVVANRLTAHLIGAYGVLPHLEIGAQLPIIAYQGGDDLSQYGVTPVSTGGLDTPWVSARYQLLSTWSSPLNLAAQLGVGIPIGTGSALGNGGFAVAPRVMGSYAFGDILASAQVSGLIRKNTELGNGRLGSQVGVDASAVWLGAPYRPELTVRFAAPVEDFPPAVEVLAGGRYPLNNQLELFGFIGPGFGTLPGTPAFRVGLGLATREEPTRPAPPQVVVVVQPPPNPCAPGNAHTPAQCPELDDDGDGIKNSEDKCPLDKGVPEYQGCPIPDRDHDGVPDAEDKCPDEPGPKERQGCPFHDRDKDGIEDSLDACPDEPGPPETRGCPIKDTDGDGVPDHLDNCPTEPGPASNQGCPLKQKQLVVITAERLEIKDSVYFDLGKSTIQKRSWPLLNQVASILQNHPDIPLIRVEGHTDSTGSADFNRTLSQDRAGAVRDYLVSRGVAPERLAAQGYGPDRPIAPNATSKGRALNRRVEFNIVNPTAPAERIEAVPEPPSAPAPVNRPDGGT